MNYDSKYVETKSPVVVFFAVVSGVATAAAAVLPFVL
jgi:hypothetical protein